MVIYRVFCLLWCWAACSCALSGHGPKANRKALVGTVVVWTGFAENAATKAEFFASLERVGYAVAVSSDGYMLTAAHVVEDEICGIPFHRRQPLALLNSPRIKDRWMTVVDQNGRRSRVATDDMGFRRLRLVHEFKNLDLALVHTKGIWETWVEECVAPSCGTPIQGSMYDDRRLKTYRSRVAKVMPMAPGWILHTDLGKVYGDSGSAVMNGAVMAGVVSQNINSAQRIVTLVAGLPMKSLQYFIRRDRNGVSPENQSPRSRK